MAGDLSPSRQRRAVRCGAVQVDRFRALPCPRCSGAARAADGTLGEACWGTAGGGRPAAVVLCDMALATAGAPRPWTCQGWVSAPCASCASHLATAAA